MVLLLHAVAELGGPQGRHDGRQCASDRKAERTETPSREKWWWSWCGVAAVGCVYLLA